MKKLFIFLILGIFLLSFASAVTWDNKAYYKLDESSGSVLDSTDYNFDGINNGLTPNVQGKINTAYSGSGTEVYINLTNGLNLNSGNMTISVWVKFSGLNSALNYQGLVGKWHWSTSENRSYFLQLNDDNKLDFFISPDGTDASSKRLRGETTLTTGVWYHIVANYNGSFMSLYLNGVLENKTAYSSGIANRPNTPTCISHNNCGGPNQNGQIKGTIDEVGIWNRSLSDSEVTELYNGGDGLAYGEGRDATINLISPTDNSILSTDGTNFTANFNITSTNPYSYVWKNATVYVWYSNGTLFTSEYTVLSGNSTQATETIQDFSIGNYEWNVYGCFENLTYSNCTWSSENASLNVGAVIEDQIYNNVTYETRSEIFQVNVTHPDYSTFLRAYLVWNGTEYLADSYMFGSTRRLTRTIIIPTIEGSSEVIDFYWKLIFSDAETNTTSSNQTINEIELTQCTSGTKFITLNLKDEQTGLFLGNTSAMNILFTYYGSSMDSTKTINQSISGNNASFCFSPTWGTFNLYGEVEYEDSTYIKRYFYFMYKNFDNQTDTYNLYGLLATESTSFIVYFTDYASLPMKGAYLELTRKSTASDEYKIVEMSKTDDFGMGVLHYVSEDEIYKINFYGSDGSYLYSTGDFKAVCLDAVCTQRWELPYTTNPDPFEGIREDPNFDYFLDIVNDSVYLIYDSTDETSYNITFEVYGLNVINETQLICSSSESNSISGTITCNLSGSAFDLFLAKVFLDGEVEITKYLSSEEDEGWKDYGTDGLIYAILIITTLTLLLIWRWEACIIGCVSGVILSGFLGFIPGVYSTIGYLIVVAIYLIVSGGGK